MDTDTVSKGTTKRRSRFQVLVAGVAGIALGVGGVSLLSPAPADPLAAARPGGPAALVPPAPPAPAGPAPAEPAPAEPLPSQAPGVPDAPIDQATAERVALAYLGEGRVTWVTQEDDRGAAWEVEVTLPNGREVDVYVDPAGQVIDTRAGLFRLLP